MSDAQQTTRFETGRGFVAALDQSGGSTPKALRAYGIDESQYTSEAEMFDLIHAARTRIITSPSFTSERILGAILFENTLDREVAGKGSAAYLWEEKGIVPFLKIDKGLEEQAGGVQLMRDNPGLATLLARAKELGVFGTKERSVIHAAQPEGIARVVAQQFEVADQVLEAGLVPIVEPEVSIDATDKAEAEGLLKDEILSRLGDYTGRKVALKLTIPTVDGFYADLIAHPNVARVVALSGGYPREDANARLARNPGLIASFSRALLDGLSADQSDEEFDQALDAAIEPIYRASIA
ncbi:fructose bisphosphate aldolase [Actinotalea sp. C106]|uniref:fructose bisphosphate aldolase n=1 Tax=Actinotalea sp. C106 TaxID=2908644 RepID=UPI0020288ADA|nr:fructose bisphosphate aldolase [Actinotalea sp. C106]